MKNIKTTDLQNAQTPIEDLRKQAEAAVKKYLDVANKSSRTESLLPNAVWCFLDMETDNFWEYITIFTEALLALSKKEVAEPFRKQIGGYYFDHFAKMIERAIYMLNMIQESDASVAAITAHALDTSGDYEKDDYSNRIYLNQVIRVYKSMAENTEAEQADWEVWDQRFE